MHASRTSALPQTRWRKSTRSGGTGDCVEVADLAANVGVRDSKDPDAQHLAFALNTWTAFVAEVRDGRFDLP
ncbi:DUF397 domain-containing protein [Actinomadura bangladeshensis]|uniref:DUF397 domain-containing protein n=2 Tax=Actinomadura bangladeshensis TaxID=453573 RepID=A0A6L9QRI8_9ACTN|nr:DUF397 domain-containing protein [Actinomadura bangladeshensis]NEA28135.1 DUF397 domain-containing protein [Actinomadura bangladeshensis]